MLLRNYVQDQLAKGKKIAVWDMTGECLDYNTSYEEISNHFYIGVYTELRVLDVDQDPEVVMPECVEFPLGV